MTTRTSKFGCEYEYKIVFKWHYPHTTSKPKRKTFRIWGVDHHKAIRMAYYKLLKSGLVSEEQAMITEEVWERIM